MTNKEYYVILELLNRNTIDTTMKVGNRVHCIIDIDKFKDQLSYLINDNKPILDKSKIHKR